MAGRPRSRQATGTVRLLLLLSAGLLMFGVLWNSTQAVLQGRQKQGLGRVPMSADSTVAQFHVFSDDTHTLLLMDSEGESDVEDVPSVMPDNLSTGAAASLPKTHSIPAMSTPQRPAYPSPTSGRTLPLPHNSKPALHNIQSTYQLPLVELGRDTLGAEMSGSQVTRATGTQLTTAPATLEVRSSPTSPGPPVCYGRAPPQFPERQSIVQTARLQWLALGKGHSISVLH